MRKKICFVVSNPLTARAFLMKHFEYLAADFDIYLVANFDEGESSFSSPFIKGVKHIAIERSISIFKDVSALNKLRSYMKQMQFDAVHSVTPKAGLIAMLAAKMAGVKHRIHIFTGQVWHTKTGIFKSILKSIDKLIVFCATSILVDGQSQRQFLIANNIIGQNSQVLGQGSISGVDTSKFVPDPLIRKKFREQLSISDDVVVYLFLGRLNTDKGLLDLADAFALLNQQYNNTKLVLVGFDEENMQQQIQQRYNTPDIVFFGPTPVPQDVLQLADVFCLPSYREGFGTSVIEASLLELPIICSDTYGLMETIVENETGLRHKTGDVQSILQQMTKMLDSETFRKNMGKRGRTYVLDHFSADMISAKWLAFYKKLLSV